MASMATQMAWGGVTFPEGISKAGQDKWYLDALRWATDYFVAAHVEPTTFYGQVGRNVQLQTRT